MTLSMSQVQRQMNCLSQMNLKKNNQLRMKENKTWVLRSKVRIRTLRRQSMEMTFQKERLSLRILLRSDSVDSIIPCLMKLWMILIVKKLKIQFLS
jgi:hypothetical protein